MELLPRGRGGGSIGHPGACMGFSPGKSNASGKPKGSGVEKEDPRGRKFAMEAGDQREVIKIPKRNGFAPGPAEPPGAPLLQMQTGTMPRGPISTHQPFCNFSQLSNTERKKEKKETL